MMVAKESRREQGGIRKAALTPRIRIACEGGVIVADLGVIIADELEYLGERPPITPASPVFERSR